MSGAKAFFDTNLFVYLYSEQEDMADGQVIEGKLTIKNIFT